MQFVSLVLKKEDTVLFSGGDKGNSQQLLDKAYLEVASASAVILLYLRQCRFTFSRGVLSLVTAEADGCLSLRR